MTEAAKALEAIGLNDATIAALLKELKENAMTKSDAEPPKEVRDAWQHYYHEAPVDFDPVAEEIFQAGWKAALARSDAKPVIQTEFELDDGLHELAFPAPPRPDASDPRYEISEVEGRFYVQRAGTDTVVAEFTDPPRPDENEQLKNIIHQMNCDLMEDKQHPDASAGLIEAAAFLEEKARYKSGPTDRLLRDWAKQLRDRAADRTGKS